MKILALGLLMLPLVAAAEEELEGVVWYDSEGNVALVEGPAAEALERHFVPEWRKREIERRERAANPLRRRSWNRGWDSSWRWGYSWGWSVRPVVVRPLGGFYGSWCGRGGGARVVIRF